MADTYADEHIFTTLVGMTIISLTMTINASVMTTPDMPATKRNPGKQYNHDK